MFACGNVTYEYDGTLDGFFCCVFESFQKKETPLGIHAMHAPQLTLGPVRSIHTDLKKAGRVRRGICQKLSREALWLVENVYLSFLEQKELYMLQFLQQGFSIGADILRCLTDDTVSILLKAQRHLLNESHKYKQFIRFSASGQVLASIIRPRNQVLPLIAPHFTDRYSGEAFLIYDATHGMALVYRPGQSAIVPVDFFVMEAPDKEEQLYHDLWCEYYDAIAIKERYNPKCRMAHMPKRYWDVMTEFCNRRKPDFSKQGAKNSGAGNQTNALSKRF